MGARRFSGLIAGDGRGMVVTACVHSNTVTLGIWESLVIRLDGVEEIVGSNPAILTDS